MKTQIIKRRGHLEAYDEKKVYASSYAAALNCHYSEKEAEHLALGVMKRVNSWVAKQKQVTSNDLRSQIIANMDDKDVALMYKHHLDLC